MDIILENGGSPPWFQSSMNDKIDVLLNKK